METDRFFENRSIIRVVRVANCVGTRIISKTALYIKAINLQGDLNENVIFSSIEEKHAILPSNKQLICSRKNTHELSSKLGS